MMNLPMNQFNNNNLSMPNNMNQFPNMLLGMGFPGMQATSFQRPNSY